MAAFSIGWWRAEHRASTVSENSTTPAAHCIYATTFDRQKNILSTADAMWKIEPDARMSVSSISPQPTMSDQPGIVIVEACNER